MNEINMKFFIGQQKSGQQRHLGQQKMRKEAILVSNEKACDPLRLQASCGGGGGIRTHATFR